MKTTQKNKHDSPAVAIVMGSASDLPTMKDAESALKKLGVSCTVKIISAHRTPEEMAKFSKSARESGIKVIIAGAGGAAHLPGMIAAYTELPVIGVPVAIGPMAGVDALLSIVQMPKGVPVASVAIGGAYNAGILAAQILGCSDTQEAKKIAEALRLYKKELALAVEKTSKVASTWG